uniref:EGF-like domain-containing protein n=1 Tax=Magallana gigas TaxID=29159 RepID=A0A8W8HXN7_MAGGI
MFNHIGKRTPILEEFLGDFAVHLERSIQVKYSFAVEEYFKACQDNSNCPDNSECEPISGVGCSTNKCKCNDGFDAVDLPFQSDGQTVTVCADLGFCSPFDNFENDCGVNGQCTVIVDEYGRIRAACECYIGYYGPSCEETSPSTKMPVITTTKKPGNIGAILPILGPFPCFNRRWGRCFSVLGWIEFIKMAAFMRVVDEQVRRDLRRQRIFRDRQNPLDAYNDLEIIQRYRLDRQSIISIIDLIKDRLERPTQRSVSLPVSLQVFATLRFLGSGTQQRLIGDTLGISKSSVCRSIEDVTNALSASLQNIKFPTSDIDVTRTKATVLLDALRDLETWAE